MTGGSGAGGPALRVALAGSAGFLGVVVTLAACAVDPAVYFPYLTPKHYAVLLASAAGGLLWAARARMASGGRFHLSAIEVILLLSLVWGVITNPDGVKGQAGNWFWLPLSALVLTFVVRQLFNPPPDHDDASSVPTRGIALVDLMTALWMVGSALAIHGLVEAFGAGGFRPEAASVKTSVTSTIGTPNGFGAFMATGIIAAVASAVQARNGRVRLVLAGAALLQLAALVGNGSRGALLSLAAAGLLVLWVRGWRRPAGRVVAGVAAVAALALAGFLLHMLNPASSRGRIIAWEVSGAMLADHPLTGVGAGRFTAEWGHYQARLWRHPEYTEFDRQASGRRHPNSELFNQLAERGLPGGALYLLLWASALGVLVRALRRKDRPVAVEWGLLALLMAILVHSLLDGSLRWVPTLVTAHLAFGLVPAPALLVVDLRRGRPRQLAMAVAVGWLLIVAVKTLREYPGYRYWGEASRAGGAERLDLLVRAQQRLRLDPDLNRQLGIDLVEAGRLEEAARVLQPGLEAWDNAPARLALAQAQLGLGWLEAAEGNARRLAAGYPDRLAPRLVLARIHHARGEEAQARAALASCIRRDTWYRSDAVEALVDEATLLWYTWYDDDPPT